MLPNCRRWPAIVKFQHPEPRLVNNDHGVDVGELGSRGAGIVQKRVDVFEGRGNMGRALANVMLPFSLLNHKLLTHRTTWIFKAIITSNQHFSSYNTIVHFGCDLFPKNLVGDTELLLGVPLLELLKLKLEQGTS